MLRDTYARLPVLKDSCGLEAGSVVLDFLEERTILLLRDHPKIMKAKEFETEIGGKKLTAIFSDLVNQANGSVLLKYGETIVLATAVMSKEKSNTDYFNLTVDYVEKFYASGEILGGRFMRREGKPSDEAILSGRVIDRTIRPLFDQTTLQGVQVIATVLSIGDEDPSIVSVNAASLALATSDIPWDGPIGAVRVGKRDGELIINTSRERSENGQNLSENNKLSLNIVICGKDGNVNMIEAEAFQVNEEEMSEAIIRGTEEIKKIEEFQKKIISEIGKEKSVVLKKPEVDEEIKTIFEDTIAKTIWENIFGYSGKERIYKEEKEWLASMEKKFSDEENVSEKVEMAQEYFWKRVDDIVHEQALKNNARIDGRKMDEVRELFAKAGEFSPIVHGSGIFYRGETHVISFLTLGGPEDAKLIDGMEVKMNKRFMHHYNFPPYSVGETGRATFVNRREVGHGALAEKALEMVLPDKNVFPYTIRLVSEAVASNGSTSMASVCASTLALMDGGVPIDSPVAGIAMGLMLDTKNQKNYKILTDIQGPEDHHGDMDFKVAGTENGITAIQLDVKVEGIPTDILKEALGEAKKARLHILKTITSEISAPRAEISPVAPKIVLITIPTEKIGLVIGPQGKTIREIKEKTGAELTIEDDGSVYITGKNGSAERAKEMVEKMTHQYAVGDIVEGTISSIKDFGAFITISPFAEGMVHISEISQERVNKVEDKLSLGQKVTAQVIKVENGKIGLSIKALLK